VRRGDQQTQRSWCGTNGIRHTYLVADEIVALGDKCIGARQVTVYGDDNTPAVQILTSNHTLTPARLVTRMRARWSIENAFKSLTAHHGIDQLCDYQMDLVDDIRMIDNPDRKAINACIAVLRAERKTASEQIGLVVTDLEDGNKQLTVCSTRLTTFTGGAERRSIRLGRWCCRWCSRRC